MPHVNVSSNSNSAGNMAGLIFTMTRWDGSQPLGDQQSVLTWIVWQLSLRLQEL
jgi:hypothetical protein